MYRNDYCKIFWKMAEEEKKGGVICIRSTINFEVTPLYGNFICWIGNNKDSFQCCWKGQSHLYFFINSCTSGRIFREPKEARFVIKSSYNSVYYNDIEDKNEFNDGLTFLMPRPNQESRCFIGKPVKITKRKESENIPEENIICDIKIETIALDKYPPLIVSIRN